MKVIFFCFWVQQLPTWRLWGEEKTEGAVYAVYLKKVRYHVPSKAISVSLFKGQNVGFNLNHRMTLNEPFLFSLFSNFLSGLWRWYISSGVGNGPSPAHQGRHSGEVGGESGLRHWRARVDVRQRFSSYLPYLQHGQPNTGTRSQTICGP